MNSFMLSLALLVCLVGKTLIFGASYPEALMVLSISALCALHYVTESKKQPRLNQDLIERLEEAEKQVGMVKDKVSSMTLAQSFKR